MRERERERERKREREEWGEEEVDFIHEKLERYVGVMFKSITLFGPRGYDPIGNIC